MLKKIILGGLFVALVGMLVAGTTDTPSFITRAPRLHNFSTPSL